MKALKICSTALRGLFPLALTTLAVACLAASPQDKPKPSAKPAVAPKAPASGGASRGGSAAGGGGAATHTNAAPVGGATHNNAAPVGGASHTGGAPGAVGGGSRGSVGGSNAVGRGAAPTGGAGRGPNMGGGGNAGSRGGNASVAHGPGGGGVHTPPGGRQFGGHSGTATFDRGGHARDVHARGMDIHHGPGGGRTFVAERPGGVRVVGYGHGYGYVQRPYAYRGVNYVSRSYYMNGVMYNRFYRPYMWGGISLNVYAPGFYYAPAYYGWAYNPGATPVVYAGWGWGGNPWYGYYGAWFSPYPRYMGPSYWLTDYLVSQTLMAAYAQQQAAAAASYNGGPVAATAPLTPEVKDMIAAEVQRQLALENQEASAGAQATPDPGSSGIARMMADGQPHIFVVSAGLDVTSNAGGECFVTEGDVLQLQGTVPPGQPANLAVLASKGQDCSKGSMVQVQVADLQEMQNHMRETIDQGLGDLQKKQGQGGIPAAPAAAAAPPQQTGFAAIAPPPDPSVQTELKQQAQEADQAEREVLQEASSGPSDASGSVPPPADAGSGAPAPTRKVTMGMSVNEVIAAWGQPKDIVDLGDKKIYVYDGMKFTFKDGKLTSAQ
jgi:hypothetical protein